VVECDSTWHFGYTNLLVIQCFRVWGGYWLPNLLVTFDVVNLHGYVSDSRCSFGACICVRFWFGLLAFYGIICLFNSGRVFSKFLLESR